MKISVFSSDVFACDVWIPEMDTEEVLGVLARHGAVSTAGGYVTEHRTAGGIAHDLEALGIEIVIVENQEEPDEQTSEVDGPCLF